MKRETYLVTSSEGQSAKTFAWNSALKAAQGFARELAAKEHTYYHHKGYNNTTNESGAEGKHWGYLSTDDLWISDSGKELSIHIEKEGTK